MAQLREDEWPRDQEPTIQEKQIPATPPEADGPVIGHGEAASENAERERRLISREPKAAGNDDLRGRSGAGLGDADRRRTRG